METRDEFHKLMERLADWIGDRPLDRELAGALNREHGPDSPLFRDVTAACLAAIDAGWMCDREGGGIRYGRVIKPGGAARTFSVDVVDMKDIAGPHHVHPHGEIDMVMPQDAAARFDGHGAGWVVYGPRSAHRPTVTGGRALVLYLLPQGAIEFTRAGAY